MSLRLLAAERMAKARQRTACFLFSPRMNCSKMIFLFRQWYALDVVGHHESSLSYRETEMLSSRSGLL
ncbi:hypothetical protein [Paenibacillus sp. NPDC093718]|uniref:hypothetical protein n=1 Tax=Paenibacillus sp. NPDC093718 TaxID=3390601 RepID=UPI003CFCB871